MRQKFSIAKRLLMVSAALLVLGAGMARGADIALAPAAPDRYVVQKGDTLWGIAQKFLRDPWRWPEIWRLNREQFKNPHWIYPGDVIVLVPGTAGAAPQLVLERETVRLSPTIRSKPLDVAAIPSIPAGDLEPYLLWPLVTGPEGLWNAASIVAGRDARVVRGEGDVVYVSGIDPKSGDLWNIYRPGRTLVAYDNAKNVLGYEQRFLGTAKVERFGDVSTVRIASAREEIVVGDVLIPAPRGQIINYSPHAPDKAINGHIIDLARDAAEAGRGWIVTLDKGAVDGLDIGTVLAISRVFPPIPDTRPSKEPDRLDTTAPGALERTVFYQPDRYLDIPAERTGLLFVYRVFDYVSYAILLNTTDPVTVGDAVRKP
jgi:hypothetical protein